MNVNYLNFISQSYWPVIIMAARFYGAMAICPLFADNVMPKMIKMIISLLLAFIVGPYFVTSATENGSLIINVLLLVNNLIVGALIGYIFSLPLWLIENIGNFIDLQRGEQFGAVINQTTKNPASSLSKLLYQGFIAYFMTINGFIYFINGMFGSFHNFPFNKLIFSYSFSANIFIELFAKYFYWLVILSLPVIFIMFLLDLSLGLLNTFVDQFNVTVLAMPIKSALALLILFLYIGTLYHAITFEFFADKWAKLL